MAKENTQALDKEQSEAYLASLWHMNFKTLLVHKLPYTKRGSVHGCNKGDYFKKPNFPNTRLTLL